MASIYRFIHYVARDKRPVHNGRPVVYIKCRVTGNRRAAAEVGGRVTALAEEAVHISVAAQTKYGEASKSAVQVLCKALGVPKSDIRIASGSKREDISVAVSGTSVQEGEECVGHILKKLSEAAEHGA